MIPFWRRWAGPVSDDRPASRTVIAAGVALPVMYAMTLAGVRVAISKIGLEPAGQSYAAVPVLILVGFAGLGAWLAWRMSKIAAVLILVVAATAAAAMDYLFATWIVVRTIRVASCCGIERIVASFWILAGTALFLAAGWSATALLSWRAMRVTFAVRLLRLSRRSMIGEVFD